MFLTFDTVTINTDEIAVCGFGEKDSSGNLRFDIKMAGGYTVSLDYEAYQILLEHIQPKEIFNKEKMMERFSNFTATSLR